MSLDAEQGNVGGEPTGSAGTAENAGGGGESQGFDLGPVLERLSAFDSRLDEFSQRLPAQEQQQAEVVDPYAQVDEMYGEDPEAAAEIRQVLEGIVGQAIQQQMNPLAQQFRQLRTELDIGELEERYPEIRENAEIAEQITQKAQQLAARLGKPDLVYDSEILEMAYLASRTQRAAAQEGPAGGGNPAELESAAGSAPGEQEPDWAKEIVSAHRRDSGVFGF